MMIEEIITHILCALGGFALGYFIVGPAIEKIMRKRKKKCCFKEKKR